MNISKGDEVKSKTEEHGPPELITKDQNLPPISKKEDESNSGQGENEKKKDKEKELVLSPTPVKMSDW